MVMVPLAMGGGQNDDAPVEALRTQGIEGCSQPEDFQPEYNGGGIDNGHIMAQITEQQYRT